MQLKKYGFMIALIFFSSCDYFFPKLSADKVDVQEAYTFLKNYKGDDEVVVLDIRSKEAFDKGHIEGSVNMDYDQTKFPETVEKLDKTKRYIVIDQNGKKGANTLVLMNELRFEKPHYIIGGYDEWIKQGLPLNF